MFLKKLILGLFISLFTVQTLACLPTEDLLVSNSDVELKTLFFSTVHKESIRMALALSPTDQTPVFNLLKCYEPSVFKIENADDWDPESCRTLSPVWMPLLGDETGDLSLAYELTKAIEFELNEALGKVGIDFVTEATLDNLNGLVSAGLGFGLEYYARKHVPQTRWGRNTRRFVRGTGWALIATAAFGGFIDLIHPFNRDLRTQSLQEVSELIDGIDRDLYFKFDGNIDSAQKSYSISIIEDAITSASLSVFDQYCK